MNHVIQEEVAAVRNVDNSIEQRLRPHGGRSVTAEALNGLPYASLFHDWTTKTLKQIMMERLGRAEATHQSVAEWRYNQSLTAWREELEADFVLVSMYMDGRNTAGRSIAVAFAGGSFAARRAIACVVRMEDGRVVWCNFTDFYRALDSPGGAEILVHSLLGELLGSPFKSSAEARGEP